MLKWIEKLRNEPESYRRKITVLISSSVTGVIFIAWLLYVSAGSLNYSSQSYTADNASTTSPVVALKNMSSQALQSFGVLMNTFNSLKAAVMTASTSDYVKEPVEN